jgi:hypothetical protein
MPHPVIYPGDLRALLDETDNGNIRQLANGECARLPQMLTNVGWTGRWQRGPRVLDSPHLLPGTVIANFKLVNGNWKYPNEHGYHAGIFVRFAQRAIMVNGLPCEFTMLDQWVRKRPGERGMAILSEGFKHRRPDLYTPSNRADEFYVVLVP